MNIIILGRLAQFHSDKNFWCVMLQWAQGTAKTWKLGECLTSCTFFRWRRKQISKVVYDWWCYFDDVWKISYEISPWNDRKLMNEKAHVWNIGIAALSIGFLHNGRCHGFRKPIHGPFHDYLFWGGGDKGLVELLIVTHEHISLHRVRKKKLCPNFKYSEKE